MRYWWVNKNQTYRHEVQGGYLWSPNVRCRAQEPRLTEKPFDYARGQWWRKMSKPGPTPGRVPEGRLQCAGAKNADTPS
jgi:hypothetical protein